MHALNESVNYVGSDIPIKLTIVSTDTASLAGTTIYFYVHLDDPNVPVLTLQTGSGLIVETTGTKKIVVQGTIPRSLFANIITRTTYRYYTKLVLPSGNHRILTSYTGEFHVEGALMTSYVNPVELFKLKRDAIIELYKLNVSGTEYRFCNWKKTDGLPISYQNQFYEPMPIEANGFEISTRGQFPTPTLKIGNVQGIITALLLQNNDLVGSRLTRKRTFVKHLDGFPQADPSREFLPTEWIVNRKTAENSLFVEYELRTPLDRGVSTMIPKSVITKYTCVWKYRGIGCEYAGGPVADLYDNPTTDPNLDQCSQTQRGCEMRFGTWGTLRIRAIPTIDDSV